MSIRLDAIYAPLSIAIDLFLPSLGQYLRRSIDGERPLEFEFTSRWAKTSRGFQRGINFAKRVRTARTAGTSKTERDGGAAERCVYEEKWWGRSSPELRTKGKGRVARVVSYRHLLATNSIGDDREGKRERNLMILLPQISRGTRSDHKESRDCIIT